MQKRERIVAAPRSHNAAVLIPVKAFDQAKNRLADTLSPADRARLARDLAERVVRAAAPLPVFIACEDDAVAQWAASVGATAIRTNGGGLSAVVDQGVVTVAHAGFTMVCIAHGDLPAASDLGRLVEHAGVTLVPDRHGDGTNILCVPTAVGFRFAYGPGSFRRHVAEAQRLALPIRIVHDDALAWDVDTSADLPQDTHAQTAQYDHAPAARATKRSMISLDLASPRRALAIAAHPDDIEFGCGATFAKWAAHGCEINHLLCTDGSKGTWDPHADLAALVATRVVEQRAAAAVLGSTGVVQFLGAVDGELEQRRSYVSDIARIIRELRPDVVLAHDPWRRWRLHPDHRAAGFLACDAVVAARDPHFFPEHGLAHHRPSALLLFESEEPDHIEDVTGFEAVKVNALLAHESQFETTMGIANTLDESARDAFDAKIRGELADFGRLAGVTSGEAFKQIFDI